MDRVIPLIFTIIAKKGCVVHGLTPRTGARWVAAQHGAGAEVTNQMGNKGGKRVKLYYYKMIPLHEDAMQVETQLIASFSNSALVPTRNITAQHVEGTNEAETTMSVAGSVEVTMDENNDNYSL